jgi:hypothetical protein
MSSGGGLVIARSLPLSMLIVTMVIDGGFRPIGRQLSVTIDSRGGSIHEIGVLLTNRLLTLIIGSWESIQATTCH